MAGAVAGFLNDFGIAYGSDNDVRAWYKELNGLPGPATIARREDHVNSVVFHKGHLFDAGDSGTVRETLSGAVVGKQQPAGTSIFKLAVLEDALIAASQGEKNRVRIYDVESDSEIVAMENKGDPLPIALRKGFSIRSSSLDLAVVGKTVYVASENVFSLKPGAAKPKVSPVITGFWGDFVRLTSDGRAAYAIACHNQDWQPYGAEVRILPGAELVATWKPDKLWRVNGRSYGIPEMVASSGDVVVIGTTKLGGGTGIYAFELPGLSASNERGVNPTALVRDAFKLRDAYGNGNPLAIIPRVELERIVDNI